MATNYFLVEAPAPVVAIEEMKNFLRVDHDDEDDLINRLIRTATETLDGPDGLLHRALGEQRWRLAMDCFPAGSIKIGLPPLKSVEAIKYIDTAGTEQTLPPEAYRVSGLGRGGLVTPTLGWPATADVPECISIAFTAGGDVPAPLTNVIFGLVSFWFDQRSVASEPDAMTTATPFGFDDVVWNWRHDAN